MKDYDHKSIEYKWTKKWGEEKIYDPDLDKAKEPYYNLMMFPYPSAEGLHVGNMYAFTGADIHARFQRMNGKNVFEPIGLDGFGIHSENYAIKVERTPQQHAKISEENFYNQLHRIGNSFDWSRKAETYDEEYYKWTQWLFIQLFKAGLAYRAKAPVNFCPSCKTVLADEQVIDGKCERCGTVVEKRNLEQWFFRITKYAERLLNNIQSLNWSEKVKIAQKNWIGKSTGARLEFKVKDSNNTIEVFTTRPDTLYGVTFVVVAPEHPIAKKISSKEVKNYIHEALTKSETQRVTEGKEKTGVFSGLYAIQPLTNEEIPIWVADYVLMSYGTGAIMGVPAHDIRDNEFAKKYNLPIKQVIKTNETNEDGFTEEKEGLLINSDRWNGMYMPDQMGTILQDIEQKDIGKKESTYHLRDWLISRQRYWGPPIPMIHCDKCGWQPVPEDQLPVLLPQLDDWKPTGDAKGPLAKLTDWVNVNCPKCGDSAKRETDVSDSFLDSSWYFFRYTSTDFDDRAFDKNRVKKWLPVNIYIGGAEHSVLHLLYARFITMVLFDLGEIEFEEPFLRFFAHGLIIKDGAKMSKSKGNVVVPDEYINKYGADTLRSYLAFLGPFSQGGDFSDSGIEGMSRFLRRIYRLIDNNLNHLESEMDNESLRVMHKTIKKVTHEISELRYNTAIAAMMEWYNSISKRDKMYHGEVVNLLKLLAPFTPFITEELWYKYNELSHKSNAKKTKIESIHISAWPTYDEKFVVEHKLTVVVQINGKLRHTLLIDANDDVLKSKEAIVALARKSEKVSSFLKDKEIKKSIYIEGKLLNFVTS